MKNHLPTLSITDEELIGMAKDFREGILQGQPSTGAFAMIRWPLHGYLSALCGIKARCIEGAFGDWSHLWLELPDGRVLDATADQFNDGNRPTDIGLPPF
jgi:hypothetical protein